MKNNFIIISCFFISSCDIGNSDGNVQNTSRKNQELTEEIIPSKPKQIEWSDGNIYSYDYTEEITKTDSLGNEVIITVYKKNPPDENNVQCDTKVCKWCSKEVYADSYEIEEYPNINWVRGQPDFGSIFGLFSVLLEGKKYYDLDNNRIRTEWNLNCQYSGPKDFCSLKCENDYKYR